MNQSFRNNKKERETGLEPAASTLARSRSTNWATRAFLIVLCSCWTQDIIYRITLFLSIIFTQKNKVRNYTVFSENSFNYLLRVYDQINRPGTFRFKHPDPGQFSITIKLLLLSFLHLRQKKYVFILPLQILQGFSAYPHQDLLQHWHNIQTAAAE